MKTNYLCGLPVLIFAAALWLSSCLNEDGVPCGPSAPEGCGYFSLSLNPTNPSFTRSGTTVGGNDEENYVEKVAVILYDKGTGIVDYQFVYNISNVGASGLKAFSGTGIATTQGVQPAGDDAMTQVVTRAEVVEEKEYFVIVIANPTAAMLTATAAGSDLEEVAWKSYQMEVEDLTGTSADRFVMSNSDGLINLFVADIRASAAEAELNPLKIHIDRAVAKVTAVRDAGFDAKITQNTSGATKIYESISDISWCVDVVNSHTYWMRKPANSKAGVAETPFDRQNYYAEDPNMDKASSTVVGALKIRGTADMLASTLNPLKLRAGNDKFEYVTENTMNAGLNAMIYGTQVVVKCRIQPLGMTAAQNYYSFYGAVFTHQQALGWLHGGMQIPPSIITVVNENYMEPLSANDLKDLLEGTGLFDAGSSEGGEYMEYDGGLTYHYGQWNVFRIPVKHFADLTPGAWGYYGVVRNNFYVVNITDITGPGTGGNEKYISSKVVVNPWISRDWDEKLGQ